MSLHPVNECVLRLLQSRLENMANKAFLSPAYWSLLRRHANVLLIGGSVASQAFHSETDTPAALPHMTLVTGDSYLVTQTHKATPLPSIYIVTIHCGCAYNIINYLEF